MKLKVLKRYLSKKIVKEQTVIRELTPFPLTREASSSSTLSPALPTSTLAHSSSSSSYFSGTRCQAYSASDSFTNFSTDNSYTLSSYAHCLGGKHPQTVTTSPSQESVLKTPSSLPTLGRSVSCNIATIIEYPSHLSRSPSSPSSTLRPAISEASQQTIATAPHLHSHYKPELSNSLFDNQYSCQNSDYQLSSSVAHTRRTFNPDSCSHNLPNRSIILHENDDLNPLKICNNLGSDLQDIQISPFDPDTDINNNNSCNNLVNLNHQTPHLDNSSFRGNSPCHYMLSERPDQSSSLPPISSLMQDSRALGTFFPTVLPQDVDVLEHNIAGDDLVNRTVSCSSMEEGEPEYADLTNVNQTPDDYSFFNFDQNSEGSWTVLNDHGLSLVKTEPCESTFESEVQFEYPMVQHFIRSPHDSDYESSVERDPYLSCIQNPSINNEVQPQSYVNQNGPLQYNHPYSGQGSPISDEGFVEGTNIQEEALPYFDKIQHPSAEPASSVQRRRSTTSSPKEKKKTSRESPLAMEKERRKPGRKPGQVSNVLHLWEFMRDLLHNPDCNGIIEWISKSEGVFRVVNSTEVARLWGEKKKNKKQMTYEKLSRSLRYSRLEGYFSDLPKDKNYPKKLCFKFGPKSKDWY